MLKQRKPLNRVSPKRAALLAQQRAPRERTYPQPATVKPLAKGRIEPVVSAAAPVPKGEPARTGKRAPTVAERAWLDFIVAYRCIACRLDGLGHTPPAVHHLLRGGVRMGHLHTIPLCDPGHHQNGGSRAMVSRHPNKTQFELRYGTEAELLASLQAEYAKTGATPC